MPHQDVIEKSQTAIPNEDQISLLELLIVLARRKWEILGVTLAATGIAVGIDTQLLQTPTTPIFAANVKILPPLKSQSTASTILSQLSGSGGGVAELQGVGTNKDTFLAILKSDSLADRLIQKFELQAVYGAKHLEEARLGLAGNSNITSSKDGVIKIEVDDVDPARAAAIANGYVDGLRDLLLRFAMIEATQRRTFFEQELEQEKNRLSNAQLALDKAPRTSKNFVELARNVKYREGVYEIVAKQYEMARLDETKDAPIVLILDKVATTEKKPKSKSRLIVTLAALVGFVAAILWAFLREAFDRALNSPSQAERLRLLRRAVWGEDRER